ncbi:hypothetical protein AB1Y20_023533 [Prymnesium parvum]|uniref:Glycerophosphodiester phosphodiesterase n=1 Tax=Prymnesium parvum TaxID=97485 RepID=A0AB34JGJ0_PRYPA
MAVDALTCANLAKLTVVSHRGASGAPSDPPIVTEHALHSLRRAGVRSVDFDVFWTRDDTAHVAHPSGLLPLLPRGVRSAFELTDAGAAALPAGPLLRVPRLLALVRDLNLTISLDL